MGIVGTPFSHSKLLQNSSMFLEDELGKESVYSDALHCNIINNTIHIIREVHSFLKFNPKQLSQLNLYLICVSFFAQFTSV